VELHVKNAFKIKKISFREFQCVISYKLSGMAGRRIKLVYADMHALKRKQIYFKLIRLYFLNGPTERYEFQFV
jgi:hypothetical protein